MQSRVFAQHGNQSSERNLIRTYAAPAHFVKQLPRPMVVVGERTRAYKDVVGAGVGASEAGEVREEAREGGEVAAEEQRVEEGVEGAEGGGGDGEEGAEGARWEAGAGVGGDDVAEEGLGGSEARLGVELVEELFHLGEHFGLGKFGDDEVVGAEGVAEGARGGVVRVWVEEEC